MLLEAFGVDSSKTRRELILPCSATLATRRQRSSYTVGGKHVLSAVTVHQWSPHTATDCSACNLFANQLRGGRPKKGCKNWGRLDNSSSQILADISERAPPSWRASQPLVLSRFLPPASSISLRDLQCAMCQCIVDQPVQMPCRKLVCCKYITHAIQRFEPAALQCPCCDTPHDRSSSASSVSISPASEVVLKILGELLIQCDGPLRWLH